PLFTSLLNYRYSKPKVAAAHIADGVELLDGHERTNYPVSVDIDDHGDDFKIRAQAAASVDPARVCDFLEVALTRLVDALERDPHGALRQLDILPEVEREEVVRRWNAGEKARPSRLCLHELFERQAARAPDAIAVIQDERALTYAELNRCANRLAHYLRVRGVRGGDRVALYARRSPELLIGMLATLKAGGAYVPLDPGYPAERLTHMLLDSAPVVVLRDAAASDDVLVRLNAGTPILDLHADDERWSAQPSGNLKLCGSHEPDVGARRLAYVIYTSGSTGAPKGVMVEHASVVNQIGALTEYLELDASDRVLQFSNIAFDASVEEIFATLSCGATLVLRTDRWLADAETFWALCGAQRISIVDLPAQFFGQLALSGRRAVPTGVRCVVIGGEAVGASALDAWFAEEGRRPRLFNTYGPTETTVSVTVHEVRGRHDDANVIGRPIANTRVYVLDAWLRPAPIGVAGELYIGGVQVARGYLNRPELTRERFIDDPFVTGGRLYRTGDLARWRTDGSLEYLGRNDFQVKIRGFRIELGEIEAQLAKVTGVREVVVLARDSAADTDQNADLNASATANSSEKRLVAYYTGDADVAALRAQAAQHLPSYMVPSAYVRLDAWPLTPNGKLDRRALPAPADDAYARAEYEAPQGAKEEALAAIWRELTRERFVDDPFVAGGRLYKTGDLARWRTDGSLEYLGRNDFQVKIRGFRIELGEIEAQLAKVAGVRETVVLARDSGSPAGEKRLVAYYTGNADVAALREQATRHLPAYMVPSAYVRLDAWPLTPNGKLDRRALPAPADDAYARAEYEAPQGAKEEALAAIWKDLLPVERISRHDNFFELGGHSLLVIGLSEKLRAAGLHADVRVVYRASTLADLAAHLGTDNQDIRIPPNLIADGDEHITPAQLTLVALSQESIDALVTKVEGGAANVQDIYPLAPLQEGILFHHLMSGESDPYVLSGVLAFRGREVMERFVSALQQVIDRHDILRTGFFWEGLEQPVQVVQRRATLPVSVVELDA
ncbi:non-ribosomal peptide synthetase, partial [Burkholderia pseudomallei]|uniref:non-ribosomal peptide synthetase n=1 Tax=Burkholderia pseudomallei TaxID=28450 RepID=UPI001605FD6E